MSCLCSSRACTEHAHVCMRSRQKVAMPGPQHARRHRRCRQRYWRCLHCKTGHPMQPSRKRDRPSADDGNGEPGLVERTSFASASAAPSQPAGRPGKLLVAATLWRPPATTVAPALGSPKSYCFSMVRHNKRLSLKYGLRLHGLFLHRK